MVATVLVSVPSAELYVVNVLARKNSTSNPPKVAFSEFISHDPKEIPGITCGESGPVGTWVGDSVGVAVATGVGDSVGEYVGNFVGNSVGEPVGKGVGKVVGNSVGEPVGNGVGKGVGVSKDP